MSNKEPPAGWVVEVTTPGQQSTVQLPSGRISTLLGAPSFNYFNVAIAAAEAAIAATTKHLAHPLHRDTSVVRPLSAKEIAALGLAAGEVKPA
jgi:hypothetical protein